MPKILIGIVIEILLPRNNSFLLMNHETEIHIPFDMPKHALHECNV